MRQFLFLFLLFLIVTPCYGQQKYKRQMLRGLDSYGAVNGIYSEKDRSGFRFQQPEEYPYTKLEKAAPNVYFARLPNRRWGMVDSLNKVLLPFEQALLARYIHGDYFVANWEGKMGVLKPDLSIRYDLMYDDLLCFQENNCLAKKDGRWGAIKSGDNIIVPFDYLDINYARDGGYQVKTPEGWGMMDSLGELIIPAIYTSLPRTRFHDYQLVVQGNVFELIHLKTGKVHPVEADEAIMNAGHWSGLVKKGARFGVVQPGKPVIEFPYNEAKVIGRVSKEGGLLYRVQVGDAFGVFSSEDGLITKVEYGVPKSFSDRDDNVRILLERAGTWYLIDAKGEPVIPPSSEPLTLLDNYGLMAVGKAGQVSKIIDANGQTILNGAFSTATINYNERRVLHLKDESGWHLFNLDTREFLAREASAVDFLQAGFFIVKKAEGWKLCSTKTGVPESSAQDVLLRLTDPNSRFRHGRMPYFRAVRRTLDPNGELLPLYGLIDGEGREVLPTEYQLVKSYQDFTLMVVKDGVGRLFDLNALSLSDSTFQQYVPPRQISKAATVWREMAKGPTPSEQPVGTKLMIARTPMVRLAAGWKLERPNKDQQQLPDGITHLERKTYFGMIRGGGYYIWQGDLVGMMNENGKMLIPPNYEDLVKARQLSGNNIIYSYAKKEGKYGLIDMEGQELTAFRYDEIRAFQEGMSRVRIGEKWGFIDRTGKELIPLIYDNVLPFELGLSKVTHGGETMFIDKDNLCQLGCD